jgi:cell division septum initiation protein DivIVA
VLSNESPYQEQFHELLDEIRKEVESLNDEIKELKKENSELRSKLKEIQDGQTDIYSAISESERLSLRHQVLGLISKIDNHLEDNQ